MAIEDLKDHEFKPGESGNPAGRPVGSKNRSTTARKWLAVLEKIENPITKKEEELSQEDIVTLVLISKARGGNVNAYKQLMDSAHGLPNQQIDHTVEPGIFKGINLDLEPDE